MEPQPGPGRGREARRGRRRPCRPFRGGRRGAAFSGRWGRAGVRERLWQWACPPRGQVTELLGEGALEAAGKQPRPGRAALGSESRTVLMAEAFHGASSPVLRSAAGAACARLAGASLRPPAISAGKGGGSAREWPLRGVSDVCGALSLCRALRERFADGGAPLGRGMLLRPRDGGSGWPAAAAQAPRCSASAEVAGALQARPAGFKWNRKRFPLADVKLVRQITFLP